MSDSTNGIVTQGATALVEATTGLVKEIPIYEDLIQPGAKQVGKAIETVGMVVNLALSPIRGTVRGYEKIGEWLQASLSEKLKYIPQENIITPAIEIAGPAIEALRFTSENSELRKLYANILSTAMNRDTVEKAHPGFIEVLKNLSNDEAILLRAFLIEERYPLIDINANFEDSIKGYNVAYSNFSHIKNNVTLNYPDLVPAYLDNLCRLGILEIPSGIHIAGDVYGVLEKDPQLSKFTDEAISSKRRITYTRKAISLTSFGKLFIENIIK